MSKRTSQLEANLNAIRELAKSDGWVVVSEHLQNDITGAALALASDPNMSESEMHFRRGAIHAAHSYSRIIEAIEIMITNELSLSYGLEKAKQKDDTPV